jgi:hypothetical protein
LNATDPNTTPAAKLAPRQPRLDRYTDPRKLTIEFRWRRAWSLEPTRFRDLAGASIRRQGDLARASSKMFSDEF